MRGKDWGTLIARLFAVLLLHDGVSVLVAHWTAPSAALNTLDQLLSGLHPLVSVTTSVLVWAFAGQFTPPSVAEEGPGNQIHAAGAIVGSVAAFFFLSYGYSFLELLLLVEPTDGSESSPLETFYNLSIAVVSACALFNARAVAKWMVR